MALRMLDVKLHKSMSYGGEGPYHIEGVPSPTRSYPQSLCNVDLYDDILATTFLIDDEAEPLSVKLPDGTTFWGAKTRVWVNGSKVCTNCVRLLRKQSREKN